jgi:hypothetical protein
MRSFGTVEELLGEIGKAPAHTIGDDIALAIVLDALLAKGFYPDGFTAGDGGRTYHYVCRE